MRSANVRYEVFCKDATPYDQKDAEALGVTPGDVDLKRVERSDDPWLFEAPRYGPPSEAQGKFRQPLPDEGSEVADVIEAAPVGYVITCERTDAPDVGYLDAATLLAFDIARRKGGVVVDRTSDVGYPLKAFERLREEGLRVRDAVSLEEVQDGDGITLRTRGMVKYGQADFVIERFPFEHVELGRRLLYDNVCDYSAFRAPVLADQTMGASNYRMFFEAMGERLLRITDCHPERKEALPGIARLLGSLLPMWEQQKAREAASEAAGERRSQAARRAGGKARAARKAGAKGRRQVKKARKEAAKSKARGPATAKPAGKAKPAGAKSKAKPAGAKSMAKPAGTKSKAKPAAAKAKPKPKAAARGKARAKR